MRTFFPPTHSIVKEVLLCIVTVAIKWLQGDRSLRALGRFFPLPITQYLVLWGQNSPLLSFSVGSHQNRLLLGSPPALACVGCSTSDGLFRPPLGILPAIAGCVLYLSFNVAHVTLTRVFY